MSEALFVCDRCKLPLADDGRCFDCEDGEAASSGSKAAPAEENTCERCAAPLPAGTVCTRIACSNEP